MSQIGADTDGLNSPALAAAGRQIGEAIDNYKSAIAAVGQIVLHQRNSSVDQVAGQLASGAPDTVTGLLSSIQLLTGGDVDGLSYMAQMFSDGEDTNTQIAGSGSDTGTHHPI